MTLKETMEEIIPTLRNKCNATTQRINIKCGNRTVFFLYPKQNIFFCEFDTNRYPDDETLMNNIDVRTGYTTEISLYDALSDKWSIVLENTIIVDKDK